MAEETIWTGSSSQVKNLVTYFAIALLDLAIITLSIRVGDFKHKIPAVLILLACTSVYAFWKWLKVRSREYRLTTERILISEGVFSKVTNSTELYRVKDLRMTQPLHTRLFGLENIELLTSDKLSPDIKIELVPHKIQLGDKCRNQIEACRLTKGTREIELE